MAGSALVASFSPRQVIILSITESTNRRLRAQPRRLATTTVVDFEILTEEGAAEDAAAVAASVAESVSALAADAASVVTTLQAKVCARGGLLAGHEKPRLSWWCRRESGWSRSSPCCARVRRTCKVMFEIALLHWSSRPA